MKIGRESKSQVKIGEKYRSNFDVEPNIDH